MFPWFQPLRFANNASDVTLAAWCELTPQGKANLSHDGHFMSFLHPFAPKARQTLQRRSCLVTGLQMLQCCRVGDVFAWNVGSPKSVVDGWCLPFVDSLPNKFCSNIRIVGTECGHCSSDMCLLGWCLLCRARNEEHVKVILQHTTWASTFVPCNILELWC